MYRARDRLEEAPALEALEAAAEDLGLTDATRSVASDLYLSDGPHAERSKPAAVAASLYAAALITGDRRSQTAVAETVGVSRLVVQQRWKPLLEGAGFEAPDW